MTKFFSYRSIITTSTGELAQLRSISGPGAESDEVDTTTMDSSSNFKTFVPGLVDGGEVELEMVYDPGHASHKILSHSMKDRVTKVWTIYHGSSTGDTDQFSGFVKSLSREIEMAEMIMATATIKVTGDPGYTT